MPPPSLSRLIGGGRREGPGGPRGKGGREGKGGNSQAIKLSERKGREGRRGGEIFKFLLFKVPSSIFDDDLSSVRPSARPLSPRPMSEMDPTRPGCLSAARPSFPHLSIPPVSPPPPPHTPPLPRRIHASGLSSYYNYSGKEKDSL